MLPIATLDFLLKVLFSEGVRHRASYLKNIKRIMFLLFSSLISFFKCKLRSIRNFNETIILDSESFCEKFYVTILQNFVDIKSRGKFLNGHEKMCFFCTLHDR